MLFRFLWFLLGFPGFFPGVPRFSRVLERHLLMRSPSLKCATCRSAVEMWRFGGFLWSLSWGFIEANVFVVESIFLKWVLL